MTLRELIDCWLTEKPVRIRHAGGDIIGIPYRLERIPGSYYYLELLRPRSHDTAGSLTFDLVRSCVDADILDHSIPCIFPGNNSR
jgi:hypothetical protein